MHLLTSNPKLSTAFDRFVNNEITREQLAVHLIQPLRKSRPGFKFQTSFDSVTRKVNEMLLRQNGAIEDISSKRLLWLHLNTIEEFDHNNVKSLFEYNKQLNRVLKKLKREKKHNEEEQLRAAIDRALELSPYDQIDYIKKGEFSIKARKYLNVEEFPQNELIVMPQRNDDILGVYVCWESPEGLEQARELLRAHTDSHGISYNYSGEMEIIPRDLFALDQAEPLTRQQLQKLFRYMNHKKSNRNSSALQPRNILHGK